MTVPTKYFQAIVDCLRAIKFHERKAVYESGKRRKVMDKGIQALIEQWHFLDKRLHNFFEKTDKEGYQIPSFIEGIIPIRNLVRLSRDQIPKLTSAAIASRPQRHRSALSSVRSPVQRLAT